MDLADFLPRVPRGDLWVFGYGSLMWSPRFRHTDKSPAMLHGYHRALCILSRRHRGTEARPGLVMGLCPGGSCWGMAFRVESKRVQRTLEVLWRREMLRKVYEPRLVSVRVKRGRLVTAIAFIADRKHPSVVREMDLHSRAQLVAQGIGERGPCTEYVRKTLEHMYALGVTDPHLARVLETAVAMRVSAASRRAR